MDTNPINTDQLSMWWQQSLGGESHAFYYIHRELFKGLYNYAFILRRMYTVGGCGNCLGALTVGASVTRNVSYYIIGHASKFVRPGSVRVDSNIPGNLQNVAFLRPDGKKH